MNAGHFSGNHVSSGDLNRSPESRGSQPSGVLPVLFVHTKRINSFSFQRTSRFYKPRFSSPQWRLCTNKIKTIPKRDSRFCKPRFSSPQWRLRTNKIKTFENFYILFVSHKKYDKKALPCRKRFEVLQTSNQHTKLQLRTNIIKSFAASRLHWRLRRFFSALRRCPCRDSTPVCFFSPPLHGASLVAAATISAALRRPSRRQSRSYKENEYAAI